MIGFAFGAIAPVGALQVRTMPSGFAVAVSEDGGRGTSSGTMAARFDSSPVAFDPRPAADGSRLYWSLVDPGLADSADMSFHEYQGTGSFYTSFSCEPENAQKNLQMVLKVLHDVQEAGVTDGGHADQRLDLPAVG